MSPPSRRTRPVEAVGIGPGAPEYVTPRSRRAIERADALVGFESVVEFVRHLVPDGGVELFACSYDDQERQLARFGERVAAGARGTAVLMGDPNVSGAAFLGRVRDAVDVPVEVVPAVSSVQVAASRADAPLEDSTFVTLHRRGDLSPDLARLAADVGDRHLLVLPRPYDWMPGDVAAHLVDAGAAPDLSALVMERLTLAGEAIDRRPLGDLAGEAGGDAPEDSPYSDLTVLVVRRDPP